MATPTPTTDQPWTRPLTALPDGANPYSTVRTVRTGDVDTGKRLRLDGVARYLQDIGTDNLVAVGANDSDPLWIVRRTVVDVLTQFVPVDGCMISIRPSGLPEARSSFLTFRNIAPRRQYIA